MKAYVLMEKGFEYDDNYYNPVEGGSPKKIYFSLDEAKQESKKLDLQKFKNESIRNYTYDIDDVIRDYDKFNELSNRLLEKYGKPTFQHRWMSLEEYQLHPQANDEESEEYSKLVDFSFFEVQEVEVDQSSFRNHQIETVLED
jgi:hypothetical protein